MTTEIECKDDNIELNSEVNKLKELSKVNHKKTIQLENYQTLKKAYGILAENIKSHGRIKKDRTIGRMMNNPHQSKKIDDFIKYVNDQHSYLQTNYIVDNYKFIKILKTICQSSSRLSP